MSREKEPSTLPKHTASTPGMASPSTPFTTAPLIKASSPRTRRSLGEVGFDTDLRLRCAASLRDHYTSEAVAFNFRAYEGRPLILPTEAAGPKPEYLEWHRREVFGKS